MTDDEFERELEELVNMLRNFRLIRDRERRSRFRKQITEVFRLLLRS